MSLKVFLNNALVEAERAAVSVGNPAFLHGVGLFETLRVYDRRPFRLTQHIERLHRSAQQLRLDIGDTLDRVPEALPRLLEANGLTDARIRFTVTPPGPATENDQPTLLIAAQSSAGYAPDLYQRGMTVCVCNPWRQSSQDPLAGHKTTCYLPRLVALREAQAKHCGEALWFTPEHRLAEGSISNIFLVSDGQLRTPPLDTPVLPGITRAAVLELADRLDLTAAQIPCSIDDLLDADEVFLTNAGMEIMPVTRVERRAIADEKPGQITLQIAEAYRELVRSE